MPRVHLKINSSVVGIASIGLLGVALAGCASSASSDQASASPSGTVSATAEAAGVPVTFKTSVSSVKAWTSDVGQGDSKTYGFNILEGKTQINGQTVTVRNLGAVDYLDSSGDFGGFVELVWADGTTLGMRQDGQATYDEKTEVTEFQSGLNVIGGSKQAVNTTGSGNWTGSRNVALGGDVTMNVTLNLVNAPRSITG